MNETLQTVCKEYIASRDIIKKTFPFDYSTLYPVCADIFVSAGKHPDPDQMKDCRRMVKESVGLFSNFRGNSLLPLVCTLATDSDPQARWERAQDYYSMLKSEFIGSSYLALAAAMLAEKTVDAVLLAIKAKSLFKRMRKEHPFLTGTEDSVFSILLAQGEKDEDTLIMDMEACYQILSKRFPKGDGLQSSTHVLTMLNGTNEEKCARLTALYDAVSARCKSYGKHYELPVLAALTFSDKPVESVAQDIEYISSYLKSQKGYRSIFGYSRKERLMHAAMLCSAAYAREQQQDGADIGTLVAQQTSLMITIMQQIAMFAVISSSAATSSSSNAGSH